MNENSLKNLRPYQPGQSGNPGGLPGRPRAKLTEQFVADFSDSWSREGAKVLSVLARQQPATYASLAAKLIPQNVVIDLQQRTPGNLSPEDWGLMVQVLEGIKTALPGAASRPPSEILSYVDAAIRAHSATVISST
jgi:hypothetical protein